MSVRTGRGRKPVEFKRPVPPADKAFERLSRVGALPTLVRGAVPIAALKRLLRDALPSRVAREMPPEVWSSFAAGIAAESPIFALALAQELHDRLAWDKEPQNLDEWWRLVVERPLEALWMGALSEARFVRKEFAHIAEHCLENFRASPACTPPSWPFVEGILDVHARAEGRIRELERDHEAQERRLETDSQRLTELREELKRLRRENSDLRAERASADRRVEALESELLLKRAALGRVEELERRALRAEKEREHFVRVLERKNEVATAPPQTPVVERDPNHLPRTVDDASTSVSEPGLRARLLRQIVKKLFKKGKIGAAHTHEDNLFRGVADHEKGIAKDVMALLYREGLLVPKPTLSDPHVSLSPDRTNDIRGIIEGRIENPRILRFLAGP